MTTIQWNEKLTQMVRLSRPSLWGNWALNSFIEVGAIGNVEPGSGDFTLFDNLQSKDTVRREINSHWSLMSTNVSKSGGTTDIAGKLDPTTGKEVKVEAHVKWDFTESGQFVSKFQTTHSQLLNNRGSQIGQQMSQIKEVASSNGFLQGEDITQGFGVITEVIYAESGMNIGAQQAGSSFTISGSIEGIAGMTDNDQAKASLKGSYFSETKTGAFESHLWPASTDEVAASNVPVAFVVSSFGPNNMFIPVWVNFISEFTVQIDNPAPGTWIVDVDVYENYAETTQKLISSTKVSGGSSGTLSNIPLDIQNMGIELNYETGPSHKIVYATPLTQIPTGELLITIHGVKGSGVATFETHVVPPGTT